MSLGKVGHTANANCLSTLTDDVTDPLHDFANAADNAKHATFDQISSLTDELTSSLSALKHDRLFNSTCLIRSLLDLRWLLICNVWLLALGSLLFLLVLLFILFGILFILLGVLFLQVL